MVHKVLIFVRYNRQEYENYYNAYIDENAKLTEDFPSGEIKQFVQNIMDNIPEYQEGELMDVCLVQENEEAVGILDLEDKLDAIGRTPIDKTLWKDEQVNKILEEVFHVSQKNIIINDNYKNIREQVKACPENYKKDNKSQPSVDASNKPPSLTKLMRLLAEKREKK